jgi:hypothetical protein
LDEEDPFQPGVVALGGVSGHAETLCGRGRDEFLSSCGGEVTDHRFECFAVANVTRIGDLAIEDRSEVGGEPATSGAAGHGVGFWKSALASDVEVILACGGFCGVGEKAVRTG